LERAQAFSPGHITGFFQICDHPNDPLLKGSRGAGVSITQGVTTKVQTEESARTSIEIKINGKATNSALVSQHVVKAFLASAGKNCKVLVEHFVDVPIGCGFGSSGAGALSLALALNEALSLNFPHEKVAQIAHVAEVECKTGLGTVIAETFGGAEIRVKAGAPGIGKVERLPVDKNYIVACLSFGPLSTRDILANEALRQRINGLGGNLVERLARHPTIPNFLKFSRRFAEHLGLFSKRLKAVLKETDRAGFTCSMAMLGETLFSIVKRDQIEEIQRIFGKHAPSEGNILISEINTEGARLL
jgi:pantoate kinase